MDGVGASPADTCPGHVHPAVGQGAASSVPLQDFKPQNMSIYALGTPRKGNFTSINRNIDPNGEGSPRAAPEHHQSGCAKHKGLVCVINDVISPT